MIRPPSLSLVDPQMPGQADRVPTRRRPSASLVLTVTAGTARTKFAPVSGHKHEQYSIEQPLTTISQPHYFQIYWRS